MTQSLELTTNGMVPPSSFPKEQYESVHSLVAKNFANHELYEHFSGAWNALSYRYAAAFKYGDSFVDSLHEDGTSPPPEKRFHQEEVLFNFFSCSFSAFEAFFYGLYSIGTFISPENFSLSTAKDQQRVSPNSTGRAFTENFPDSKLVSCIDSIFNDAEYQKIREVRNILTHRTAPGRRMFVGLGAEDAPPTEWKLNDMPLNENIITESESEMSRILDELIESTKNFLNDKLPA